MKRITEMKFLPKFTIFREYAPAASLPSLNWYLGSHRSAVSPATPRSGRTGPVWLYYRPQIGLYYAPSLVVDMILGCSITSHTMSPLSRTIQRKSDQGDAEYTCTRCKIQYISPVVTGWLAQARTLLWLDPINEITMKEQDWPISCFLYVKNFLNV